MNNSKNETYKVLVGNKQINTPLIVGRNSVNAVLEYLINHDHINVKHGKALARIHALKNVSFTINNVTYKPFLNKTIISGSTIVLLGRNNSYKALAIVQWLYNGYNWFEKTNTPSIVTGRIERAANLLNKPVHTTGYKKQAHNVTTVLSAITSVVISLF